MARGIRTPLDSTDHTMKAMLSLLWIVRGYHPGLKLQELANQIFPAILFSELQGLEVPKV